MLLAAIVTLGAFVLVLVVVLIRFVIARREAFARIASGGEIVETERGPVEVECVGNGPVPALILHGGVGGWDQAVALGVDLLCRDDADDLSYRSALLHGADLLDESVTIICPSRVGYLGTPLSSGRTPGEGADAIAAALDRLGIVRVAVIGISGGGPTAVEFALRHPERCTCLAMVAAISKHHLQPAQTTDSIAGRVIFSSAGAWLLDLVYWVVKSSLRVRPRWALKHLLKATETFDADGIKARVTEIEPNAAHMRWLHGLLESAFPPSARRIGLENDLRQFATFDERPVRHITCPTLVVHGAQDGNIPFDHAEFIANNVPDAELLAVEGAGHLFWLSDQTRDVRRHVRDFVLDHADK